MDDQPFYCEENIWRALSQNRLEVEAQWAMFISNERKQCALWSQRAAPVGQPVVWDYHVVALGRRDDDMIVLDLDHTAGRVLPFEQWFAGTFPFVGQLPVEFEPMFRVVARDVFLAHFESDRSHMRDPLGQWLQPPPQWQPPSEDSSNLMRFVSMSPGFFGAVYDVSSLCSWIGRQLSS